MRFEPTGLNVLSMAGSEPTLIFCHSRCGNQAVWKYVYLQHVIPFIKKLRLPDQSQAVFSTDGESIVIEAIQDAEVLQEFTKCCTDVIKHCASSSARTNALDAGKLHLAAKTINKYMDIKSGLKDKAVHQLQLDTFLQESFGDPKFKLPKSKRDFIVDAILRACTVVSQTYDKDRVSGSFRAAGQVLLNDEENYLDLKLSFNPNYKTILQSDIIAMRDAYEWGINLFKSEARCPTDDEMTAHGIPIYMPNFNPNRKPNNLRPLSQQRLVVLNSKAVVDHRKATQTANAQLPVLRQQRLDNQKANKENKARINAEKKAKTEEIKAKKIADLEIKATQTKAKKAEREAKAQECQAKKIADLEIKATQTKTKEEAKKALAQAEADKKVVKTEKQKDAKKRQLPTLQLAEELDLEETALANAKVRKEIKRARTNQT